MPYNIQVVDCIKKIHNNIQEIKYKSNLREFMYSPKDEEFNCTWVGSCSLPKIPSSLNLEEELKKKKQNLLMLPQTLS